MAKKLSLFKDMPKTSSLFDGKGLGLSPTSHGASTPKHAVKKHVSASKRFDFPKEKGYSTYSAIYVPSTQDVNKKINAKKFEHRITQVRNFMTNKFGGTTTVRGVGSYTAKSGKVVAEKVAVVENFSSQKDWKANDQDVEKFVHGKAKEWGQESVSFEYEAPRKTRRIVFVSPKKETEHRTIHEAERD